MNTKKEKSGKLLGLAAAVLLTAVLVFTGCPSAAGGNSGGSITPPASAGSYNAATGKGVVGGVEFTMKKIDAVTNKNVGHADYNSNNDVHPVSLSAYLIGETEVTQELWYAVMGNNPSNFSSSPASGETQGKRLVEKVSWYQAIAFCNKLSKACNLDPCYTVTGVNFDTLTFDDIPTSSNYYWNNAICYWNKNGFRLPTEAEWEWAAMGGTTDKWAGTDDQTQLVNYAWYGANSSGKTHEVKQKQPNGYGLYDMSGNVWEWCWDRYGTLPNPLPEDYSGAVSGTDRVMRGGSWLNFANGVARAFRSSYDPDYRSFDLGLRVACRP